VPSDSTFRSRNEFPRPAKEVYEDRFGDCKGLSALLIGLLRARGFEAHPALARTKGRSLAEAIPNISQFNHFIVQVTVGGKSFWLDRTADFCHEGQITAWAAANPVLLLKPGAIGLIDIPDEQWQSGTSQWSLRGTLSEEGALRFTVRHEMDAGLAVTWRRFLASSSGQDRQRVVQAHLLPEGLAVQALRTSVSDLSDWSAPVVISAEMSTASGLPRSGSKVFLPKVLPQLWTREWELGQCEERLDLRDWPNRVERWRIELPEGFVLAKSDSVEVSSPGFCWQRRLWQEGNALRLDRRVEFEPIILDRDQVAELYDARTAALRVEAGYLEFEVAGQR